ncbi:isopeptide-forming domain-containing fimbrial protein [Bifidobacterium sp. ESL0732]|uniref:isopeptide-forming domain-containing fimbrial protein n=1 Tax=Bifidobacterium sp. ESL0732 TaxID=2983222 RepID=UPI0023F75407|nr:isopeptide-forming domain-containing fimbrial protein [Bifidobacterium sp. ESL0732]WEV64020.1 isopeptide-forming domain-containing fimbrial protein [Bifidobacterium sp. ESL0732]
MAVHKSLFKAVAAAMGAVAMLACSIVGVGTANAGTVSIGNNGQITVTDAEAGHEFKAVQIGAYSSAENDGNSISGLEVEKLTTSPMFANAVDSAATEAGATTPAGTSGECPNDAVCWISKHWLGYDNGRTDNQDKTSNSASTGYAGKLRNFVTKLQNKQEFKDAITAAAAVSVSNGKAEFTGLAEGLYVIEDVTAQNQSIPMLVGTTVGSDHLSSFVGTGLKGIGQINAKKSGTPTVAKKWVSTTDANNKSVDRGDTPLDGDIMHFKLTSSVPMTAGFTNYFFKITDKPSAGLEYVANSARVTVDGTPITVVTAPSAAPLPTPNNEVYFDQGNISGAPYIGFTFPNVMAYTYNAPIVITYDMKVVQTGKQKNIPGVDWSSSVANQPTGSCVADSSAPACGATQHAYMTGVKFSSYYLKFHSVDGAKGNAPTGGTTFEVYRKGDNKPLTFRKQADGSYVYHPAEDEASHSTSNLVSADGKHIAEGGESLGGLKLDGLPPGIYTIKQTGSPSSAPDAAQADFDVSITEDPSNDGAYVTTVRDDANGLVGKPAAASDKLGADITVNVTQPKKSIDGLPGIIGTLTGHPVNGPGSLAATGISIVALLVMLCALVLAGTALMRRRHRIQR